MFDKPRLALMIAYVAFPNLATWALIKWVGVDALGYICMFFVGFGSWYVVGIQLGGELANYQSIRAYDGGRLNPSQPEQKRTLLDMNTGKMVNAFDTPKLKIDHRRHFFFLLNRQIESGFPVNLTESYWIKKYIDPRHPELGFRPKRWKGKNKDFQDMMKELDGSVFERVATDRGNATYDVRDSELVRRGAEGQLPY